ncbi:MAG: hypothetical protein C1O27_002263 [Chloroflexi bacterium]|jgi:hypothetical protein|nr:MAG: hypothetical protein C1O27_002263 [Chloroflexota bacterium]
MQKRLEALMGHEVRVMPGGVIDVNGEVPGMWGTLTEVGADYVCLFREQVAGGGNDDVDENTPLISAQELVALPVAGILHAEDCPLCVTEAANKLVTNGQHQ